MSQFENKTVLITGGAAGIGKTTADKFLQEGATVEIWDLNEKAAKDQINAWEEEGLTVSFQKVNVADEDEVAGLLGQ